MNSALTQLSFNHAPAVPLTKNRDSGDPPDLNNPDPSFSSPCSAHSQLSQRNIKSHRTHRRFPTADGPLLDRIRPPFEPAKDAADNGSSDRAPRAASHSLLDHLTKVQTKADIGRVTLHLPTSTKLPESASPLAPLFNKASMQEEPIDRARDHWMDRKRRIDHEEAIRRDEMEARYQDASGRRMNSPPMPTRADSRLAPPNGSDGLRSGYSPRTQLPSINNLTNGSEEHLARDEAEIAMKRRRLADGHEALEDRRRDGSLTPPEQAVARARSPLHPPRTDLRPPQHRYGDERDGRPEDARSPRDGQFSQRPNARGSPLADRGRPMPSTGDPGLSLPPVHDFRRPSVLTGGPEDGYDSSPSLPGLARRRGDAAQAKASRLHIDTGTGSGGAFDMHPTSSRSTGIAKSAPPQKLTFEREGAEPPLPYELGRREGPRHLHPQAAGNYPAHTAMHGARDYRTVSGSRLQDLSEASGRRDSRDDVLGPRDGQRMPELPQTANPLARPAGSAGRSAVGGGYVPQTATLPSPAYHTTQFARVGANASRALGPNPPPTARLPEHLRSSPSSKEHFLSLFSDFYESLHDSRTMKATLEDQIRRSNTLLQTLQSSRRVLEETVERRVREERVLWEGRVRGLEARVRELEARHGDGPIGSPPSLGRDSPSSTQKSKANGSRASSATREANEDRNLLEKPSSPSQPQHKPALERTVLKSVAAVSRRGDSRADADDGDQELGYNGELDELRSSVDAS